MDLCFLAGGQLGRLAAPGAESERVRGGCHGRKGRGSGVAVRKFLSSRVQSRAAVGGKEDETRDRSERPPPLTLEETAMIWVRNILQTYGNVGVQDGAPVAEGSVSDITGGPLFIPLKRYFDKLGSIFKLAFGPKQFIVVSDPVIAKYILHENSFVYDKGILAEILEPIMGKGLIPADFETWKIRRRAIVPGFHAKWLDRMLLLFAECTERLISKMDEKAALGEAVEMESHYCSLSLDIIGKAVFNYEFGSVTNESPVIKAVYRVLREAEHRSTFFLPYWKVEPLTWVIPQQVEFKRDMTLLNDTLDELIQKAVSSKKEEDLQALQSMDYDKCDDISLLRFLVDLRGEEVTCRQLRDDLITMLIAGHETTGALLTWASYLLAQNPEVLEKARQEVDRVIQDRRPTMDDIKEMGYIRRIVAETLRLYPEPPFLIRRALADDVLPQGFGALSLPIPRGTDIFISLYNLHRSPQVWRNPDIFDPDRYLEGVVSPIPSWKGQRPMDGLYPNEVTSDYAFLPFGGGSRKCVGDQFSVLESTVCLSMLIRRFDMELATSPEQVGMTTGATIHTENGLYMKMRRRNVVHEGETDPSVVVRSGVPSDSMAVQ